MIIQFLVSLAATLSFAVLFSAEKKQLFFCGLTGALGWIVYLICLQYHTDNAIANLIATFALTLVARILSAVRRTPVTVFLLTGIFPLVPGAGIYYTSYYFIMGDMSASAVRISTRESCRLSDAGIIFGFALYRASLTGFQSLRIKINVLYFLLLSGDLCRQILQIFPALHFLFEQLFCLFFFFCDLIQFHKITAEF